MVEAPSGRWLDSGHWRVDPDPRQEAALEGRVAVAFASVRREAQAVRRAAHSCLVQGGAYPDAVVKVADGSIRQHIWVGLHGFHLRVGPQRVLTPHALANAEQAAAVRQPAR